MTGIFARRWLGILLMSSACWAADAPTPLLSAGHPVDWWFVFKLNAQTFLGCGGGVQRVCAFGGTPQPYRSFGQQFAFASSDSATLQQGGGCVGDTTADPVGATFDQVYNGTYNFVVWNDQFYNDPKIKGCTKECGSPWGHSKGMVAWNDAGNGFVLQVSTPSWPAAGSSVTPRKTDGNTLGCVMDDDVEVSQQFFALAITKDDLVKVLGALQNSSVVTDPKNKQIVKNGGPPDVQKLVASLGVKSKSPTALHEELSTGVELISKPSALAVPPWQMVSSFLAGVSLRAATWWESSASSDPIYSTTASTKMGCWSNTLGKPGAVEIATSGQWNGTDIGLTGGLGPQFNHAKIGVSTSGTAHYSIFGDMNQEGSDSGQNCAASQNGRGGLFYVIDNQELWDSVGKLLQGQSAPTSAP